MFILDFFLGGLMDQLIDWIYSQLVGFFGNFFAAMGNMGVELFDMEWVQSIVLFFSYLGWALYGVGLVVAVFEVGIECQTGRANVKDAALNAIKGFMAVGCFTLVPVELYKLSVTLQASLTAGITGYGEGFDVLSTNIITSLQGVDIGSAASSGVFGGIGSITSPIMVIFIIIMMGYAKKNYGAEGAEVIVDNCQVNLYGGFAPASQTAVELSKALGSRTVMSGSISRGKNDPSQSLQMIERPLMTPDELKSMPKGSFIVAKTGVHPMKVKLRLFLDWGIRFGEPYEVPEKAQRAVAYADKQELEESIIRRHYGTVAEEEPPQDVPAAVGGMNHGMQAEKNSRKTILRP